MKTGISFRRGLLFLWLMSGFGVVAAWAGPVSVAVPNVTGAVGSDVKVPILLKGAKGVGAVQMDVLYDSLVLLPKLVEPGTLLSGLADYNIVQPGRLRIALATSQPINGDGEMLVVTMKVLGGKESPLGLENCRVWQQADAQDVAVTLESGQLTVSSSMTLIVIGIAAVVGTLLLIAIPLMMRRKPSEKARTIPPQQVPTTEANASPAMAGIAFCTKCGGKVNVGDCFCRKCGNPVAVAETEPKPSSAPDAE